MQAIADDFVTLGQTDVRVPRLGVGTWQWGDRLWWGYGGQYDANDAAAAYGQSLALGVNFFDTAEIYGMGQSERLLGKFQNPSMPDVIATKFFPFPWRWRPRDVQAVLRASLRRLHRSRVDLYQMHRSMPILPLERWMEGLASTVAAGRARAVGVSNFDAADTERAHRLLQARGTVLATNQIAYSLVNRSAERNGVIQRCADLGITVIAYSPLGMGVLGGKYSAESPPPGLRRGRYSRGRMAAMAPLLDMVRRIGSCHDRSPAQVSLNWIICKGVIPIPGAKTAKQAIENAGALGWRLTENEIGELDELSGRLDL